MSQQFPPLPFRQVHLDFHTSEYIQNVGRDFDAKTYQDTLKAAHVNSVTTFGVCHHGWAYFDSKTWPVHPEMKEPLLPQMLEACKEIGVQAPVYLTVGWNEYHARQHPEWIIRYEDGRLADADMTRPKTAPRRGYYRLCLNTPYLDEICNVTREVMERFNPVGIFYDIIWEKPCYCDACLKSLADRGASRDDKEAVQALAKEVYLNYHRRTTETIWAVNPEARVYHNGSDKKGRPDLMPYYSHYEIESLPTTDWGGGYEHFPQNARYFKHKGLDYLGMTGKFHQSWGEFGGYKHPVALRYETARMIMLGGKCSIGDQMLPEGVLDPETYRIIGEAYREVEAKEAWCTDAQSVAEVAVVCPSAIAQDPDREEAEVGASMVLSEGQYLFDIIDHESDFSPYQVVILPDEVEVDAALKAKVEAFLARGGSVLASGDSGLDRKAGKFVLDYGLKWVADSEWYIDFFQVRDAVAQGVVRSPFFNFLPGAKTEVVDAEVLADTVAPHFNRTFDKFCSHGNTPAGPLAGYPAIARKGNLVYIAPKVFTMYREKGMRLHRDLIHNCLDLLLPSRGFQADLPSGAMVAVNDLPSGNRILHVLYATPIPRGQVNVIEDVPVLSNVEVGVRAAQPSTVRLVPENANLDYTYADGVCRFTLPEIDLHRMVEIVVA